ncbi:hypothetical protein CEUSTIGMA_g6243.t1 [Chlamydomonas eustigma]|uniref:Uncharacterized protein n=1 Tax=Chlamydomonas eustigma TaxID=1157962 RepID=A0A250X6Y3_9CHLO|nr:hypothetical protein CEUSTIGMA_g6243.t1 [Chlamydomonas eustigma]|eukprot:GAX78806.1 hypothetical protein CEUSTIGMA_g6243.t1 [Chlamydomonas eustigma]
MVDTFRLRHSSPCSHQLKKLSLQTVNKVFRNSPNGSFSAPPRHETYLAPCKSAESSNSLDIKKVTEMISLAQPMEDDMRASTQAIAVALNESVATVRNMAFKKRGLLNLLPEEMKAKIETIASIVEVPYEQARRMAVIQPGLLFDTEKQAQVLSYGIKSICYELNAPKEEVVTLILENQSVLHGRELHLSVADIAHLSLLREPKGRIVD